MSIGVDFVEGVVDDINVDLGGLNRVGEVTLRYVTIRLKVSEDRFIEVRFKGCTGPITIIKGHKIKAYGDWIRDDLFRARRIEDLTTGEWWEAKTMIPIYLVLIGVAGFLVLWIISLVFTFFSVRGPEFFILALTIPFIVLLIVLIYPLYRMKKSYKIINYN